MNQTATAPQCYRCGAPFTRPQQWAWEEARHSWPARGRFLVRVCRGPVVCAKRRIARLGRNSVRPAMRAWLGLEQ